MITITTKEEIGKILQKIQVSHDLSMLELEKLNWYIGYLEGLYEGIDKVKVNDPIQCSSCKRIIFPVRFNREEFERCPCCYERI